MLGEKTGDTSERDSLFNRCNKDFVTQLVSASKPLNIVELAIELKFTPQMKDIAHSLNAQMPQLMYSVSYYVLRHNLPHELLHVVDYSYDAVQQLKKFTKTDEEINILNGSQIQRFFYMLTICCLTKCVRQHKVLMIQHAGYELSGQAKQIKESYNEIIEQSYAKQIEQQEKISVLTSEIQKLYAQHETDLKEIAQKNAKLNK